MTEMITAIPGTSNLVLLRLGSATACSFATLKV